ncbi:DUF433 domain-containing protein [bacterium]|nr:DUF433 domain-containing protein [bacterium]
MVTKEYTEFKGIYVAPDAALYLTATLRQDVHIDRPAYPIHSRNLIRWIRIGLMSPELRNVAGKDLLIGFEDLISMRVIAILRSLGVSWRKIHRAEDWLRDRSGHPRPFAIERVWTEAVDVFAEFHEGFIAASRGGQLVFTEMVGQYLQSVQDMIFIPHNGVRVANAWTPHEDVMMNPKIQFGEPCVKGTRMRTRILWQMLNGGDSISYLTRAFNLKETQVNHALEWENRLRTVQASEISR